MTDAALYALLTALPEGATIEDACAALRLRGISDARLSRLRTFPGVFALRFWIATNHRPREGGPLIPKGGNDARA